MNAPVLVLDAGLTSHRQADHLIAALRDRWLLDPAAVVVTHHERGGHPRIVVTLDLLGAAVPTWAPEGARDVTRLLRASGAATVRPAPTVLLDTGSGPPVGVGGRAELGAANRASDIHRRRTSGRVVSFAGVDRLRGVMAVADLLAQSAIDRLQGLAGIPVDGDQLIDTRSFVRPQWRDGVLVLDVVPMVGGVLAPFELRDPAPCCSDHREPAAAV